MPWSTVQLLSGMGELEYLCAPLRVPEGSSRLTGGGAEGVSKTAW